MTTFPKSYLDWLYCEKFHNQNSMSIARKSYDIIPLGKSQKLNIRSNIHS